MGVEHRYDPCSIGYWQDQAQPFVDRAQDGADGAVATLVELQAIVAEVEEDLGKSLAPITDYLDEQLAAAQAYADGVVTDTDALVQALADNSVELVADLQAAATDAALEAVAAQCEPYTA